MTVCVVLGGCRLPMANKAPCPALPCLSSLGLLATALTQHV